jgi:2,4-dienoyl-CoA reductase-like NADH-dependent reductase (Old Yellow Enzyme family)
MCAQIPFAAALKAAYPAVAIGAVGLITNPKEANAYIQDGKADVVSLAREMVRNPHWVMVAAQELGVAVKPACQYERGWTRMLRPAAEVN